MSRMLITGANRGIGLELTRQALDQGHEVIACCRAPDQAEALSALDSNNLSIRQLHPAEGDSVDALKTELDGQAIDVLINNAGAAGPAPNDQSVLNMDYDGWLETFSVNTLAPLRMLQALRENLKQGANPRAITITSQMGALDLNMPVMYAYCSSKAAVNKVMRMASAELAADNISVRLIHPGWVQTDMGGPQAQITATESAAGILKVVDESGPDNNGTFVQWNGETHAW